MNHESQKIQRGFTLTEIVVATTIFATVITVMFSLFNYTLKINRRTEALRQASQGVRNFTEFLVKEIRNGKIDYQSPPVVSQCSTSYASATKYLALVNVDGERECIYFEQVGSIGTIKIAKSGVTALSIPPVNFNVDQSSFQFFVRPATDPYVAPYPKIQPFVSLTMKFVVTLPTGEIVTIPYQTSVSTEDYSVPHS